MARRVLASVAVLLSVCRVVSAAPLNPCTEQKVADCLAPLKDVDYQVGSAVVPYMNETILRHHCKRYDKFESCMEDVRPHCTLTEKLVYQGIEDSYKFLCVDGFNDYLEYRNCFADTNLHAEGDTCNNTFTSSMAGLRTDGDQSTGYKKDRICQYVKQYLDCVERVIESFCSKEAAEWQRTMDEKSLSPLVSRMGCHLDGSLNWVPIVIGVALAISVLVIAMSIILLYLQKRKKRLDAANRQVTGAPPPYDPGPYAVYDGTNVGMAANGIAANGVANGMTANGTANGVNGAGPLPHKYQPGDHGDANPPAYHSHDLHAPSPPAQAVAAGYFGASSDDANDANDRKVAEMRGMPTPTGETLNLPQYEQLNAADDAAGDMGVPEYEPIDVAGGARSKADGYSNPAYNIGYFGTDSADTK